jgi:hypothetical protein
MAIQAAHRHRHGAGETQMDLASVPGSTTATDLRDAHQQAGASVRDDAGPRFWILTTYLAYLAIVTALMASLLSNLESSPGVLVPVSCASLGVMGVLVTMVFLGLEVRQNRRLAGRVAGEATYGVYLASIGYFALTVVIASALLLVRQ